ncbi:hypothetical protein DNTS_034433 [Danionella cerebrum]|uniref:Uncharacterized protein n=1 Tax=Danionella cerebrum TaxID=2873325 RepID=A0A553MQI0_9TELE|nr:hypothetical protein DNTS_034433 [Danionella translucida]
MRVSARKEDRGVAPSKLCPWSPVETCLDWRESEKEKCRTTVRSYPLVLNLSKNEMDDLKEQRIFSGGSAGDRGGFSASTNKGRSNTSTSTAQGKNTSSSYLYSYGTSGLPLSGSEACLRMTASSTDGIRRTQDSSSFSEKKTKSIHSQQYDGSSSDNSPELTRKVPGSSRGRSQSRGTELDDVKKLLKGTRSASVSPTRSPTASPLPIPSKASTLHSMQVEQFETPGLDADLASYTWSSSTLPSSLPSSLPSTGTTYGYHSNTNNMATGGSVVSSTSPSSLSVYGFHNNLAPVSGVPSASGVNTHSGYGVQKNYSTGPRSPLAVSTGVSAAGYGVQKNYSSTSCSTLAASTGLSTSGTAVKVATENVSKRYILLEKENIPLRKETEELVLTKDSGKQFTNSTMNETGGSYSDVSVKKETMVANYSESAPVKSGSGTYYTSSSVSTKDKATYAEIQKTDEDDCKCAGGLCACGQDCCSWWKWLLGFLLSLLLLLGLLFGLIALSSEVKKLKSRVSTLEAMSSSMNAHTSRLSASVDAIDGYNEAASKAAFINSLDSAAFSDSAALHRSVQQILRAELQSEAMKGTSR